jgi:hypothetical protein
MLQTTVVFCVVALCTLEEPAASIFRIEDGDPLKRLYSVITHNNLNIHHETNKSQSTIQSITDDCFLLTPCTTSNSETGLRYLQ